MEFFNQTEAQQEDPEKRIFYPPGLHSDLILDAVRTLPIQIKLIFYACLRLSDQCRKNIKTTVGEVAFEYQRLAREFNINVLYINQVTDKIKELEMLGFLKCSYIRSGQIRYISIYEPAEIPKFMSVLKEELGKVKVENIVN